MKEADELMNNHDKIHKQKVTKYEQLDGHG
jgi:hypothetical protein